ncbi:hypothetical protein LG272_08265 [Pseudidiomarina marina]|uniref:hypothetical protein n=1 Tax=Pseudidiomarina marina TaxID=502366 RepID=UPI0038515245
MSLPWLREPWRQLVADYHNQRFGHAHCIPDRKGVGAEAYTQTLVKFLLCLQPQKQACGQCKSCLLMEAGTHPDYYEVASEDNRAIGVDKIRELTQQLQQTASQHGSKVAWIKDAHRMTIEAANALLKTLEEPSGNTYLILSPERTSDLLPTLRSRMRLHTFHEPSQTAVEDWLTQQLGRTLSEAERVRSQQFPGAPLTALAALNGELADPVDFVQVIANAMISETAWPQPKKDDVQQWLEASLAWLQELIRIRQRVAQQRLHYPQLTLAAQEWLQREQISVTTLNGWLALCYNLRKITREQSGLNLPLLLQQQWLQWIHRP